MLSRDMLSKGPVSILYLAYNALHVPKLHDFQLLLFVHKIFITQKNYLKFSMTILNLIISFIANKQDQRIT